MNLLRDFYVIREMRRKRREGASVFSVFMTNEYSVSKRWKKEGMPAWKRFFKMLLIG